MTDPITVAALAEGNRVLLDLTDAHGPQTFATDPATGRAAEVLGVEKIGRRRRVLTDLGPVEAGPTARVLLAPAEEEPDTVPVWPVAIATVDAAGRLTAESTVSVGTTSAPVPDQVDAPGGSFAITRLGFALEGMGYRQVTPWVAHDQGSVTAHVERVAA